MFDENEKEIFSKTFVGKKIYNFGKLQAFFMIQKYHKGFVHY